MNRESVDIDVMQSRFLLKSSQKSSVRQKSPTNKHLQELKDGTIKTVCLYSLVDPESANVSWTLNPLVPHVFWNLLENKAGLNGLFKLHIFIYSIHIQSTYSALATSNLTQWMT